MTEQHRATPEHWANMQQMAEAFPLSGGAACILELRARVESLQQQVSELQTAHNTATDWRMEQDARLRALEAAQRPSLIPLGCDASADSLVERVANAIGDSDPVIN
jgi:hypothetical protein